MGLVADCWDKHWLLNLEHFLSVNISFYLHRILGGCFGRCWIRDKLNFDENKRKSICGINNMLNNGNKWNSKMNICGYLK